MTRNHSPNESPLVSLVIPVFDMRRTLEKCLRSALAQSFDRLEIVIADDASTDSSMAIARHLTENRDNVIIVTHDSNSGQYATRLRGATNASAPFVAFLDADDWLEPDAVKELYNTAAATGADMVQMRIRRRAGILSFNENLSPYEFAPSSAVTGADFDRLRSYIGMGSTITNSCCDKLYRRDLFVSACSSSFPMRWGEDQYANILYLKQAKSLAFSDYVGYNYRWGGTMTSYRYNILQDFKALHHIKLSLGQDPERTNAELIKLLRYHVRQLITELGWTPEAVCLTLKPELNDPVWAECGLTQTAEQIVAEEQVSIKHNPLKYFTKALLR